MTLGEHLEQIDRAARHEPRPLRELLLGDAAASFTDNCLAGIEPDLDRISGHLEQSLMLATALAPAIGYEKTAAIVQSAMRNGTTLREETIQSGLMTAEEFDERVRPDELIAPR